MGSACTYNAIGERGATTQTVGNECTRLSRARNTCASAAKLSLQRGGFDWNSARRAACRKKNEGNWKFVGIGIDFFHFSIAI